VNSITFTVGDIVCVKGYQGSGRIAFINSASNVGVIIGEMRIHTDLGKLYHASVV